MKSDCTQFCTILHKPDDKSIINLVKYIKQAETKNKNLFHISPNHYFINIVYSTKEYDKKAGLSKVKTHRGGYVKKNEIIVLSQRRGNYPSL